MQGSVTDTALMILVPLYSTAHLVHCNVWEYMSFGSLYASWLTLIHSECENPPKALKHLKGQLSADSKFVV